MARFVITSKPFRQRRALVTELVSGDGPSPDAGQFVSLGLGSVECQLFPLAEDKARVTAAEKMVLIHLFISQGKTCSNCFSYSHREKVRVLRKFRLVLSGRYTLMTRIRFFGHSPCMPSSFILICVSASHWVLSSSPGRLGECPRLRNNRTLESSRILGRMVDTCLWVQGRKSKSWTRHWPWRQTGEEWARGKQGLAGERSRSGRWAGTVRRTEPPVAVQHHLMLLVFF